MQFTVQPTTLSGGISAAEKPHSLCLGKTEGLSWAGGVGRGGGGEKNKMNANLKCCIIPLLMQEWPWKPLNMLIEKIDLVLIWAGDKMIDCRQLWRWICSAALLLLRITEALFSLSPPPPLLPHLCIAPFVFASISSPLVSPLAHCYTEKFLCDPNLGLYVCVQ